MTNTCVHNYLCLSGPHKGSVSPELQLPIQAVSKLRFIVTEGLVGFNFFYSSDIERFVRR